MPPTEQHRQITRSAAFRLTLRFAAIFVVVSLVLGLTAGLAARWAVKADIRSDIEDELARVAQALDAGAGQAALTADEGLIVGHFAPDGRLLRGELALPEPREGWSEFLPPGIDDDEVYWVKAARLSDGSLAAVAASSEPYHDIVELMNAGAAWAVIIALPLALISGAALSLAVMRRLAPIAATAEAVRGGALSRRAPVTGRGDEFDRLADGLNAMLDRIESLHHNLRNVTVGIAHELRTPLARARNRLNVMKGDAAGHPVAEPQIDAVTAEIDRLLVTFDALLRIGQIEADAERRGFETVDFSALVDSLAEVYEPVAAEQGKRLAARIAAGVSLSGNRALLTQMVSNLVENAIEHTPPRTSIRLALEQAGPAPLLVVEDDGPGIPAEESERVFDRFHRLEQGRKTPGNGLGLSLVRSICSLHGFTVRLAPTPHGARFEVAL